MHLSIFPVALVDGAIGPFVSPEALHIFIDKVPLITATILPCKAALSMLVPIFKSTGVLATIREDLGTLAMEKTISEMPLVRVPICCV